MNSDLTPAPNVVATDNPQAIYSDANGVNSSYFQQSAGMESLKQNHQLSVVQTGEPIEVAPSKSSSMSTPWILIIIGLVLVVAGASLIRNRLMKPKPIEETIKESEKPNIKPVSSKVNKSKGKKKPRSKRHQK